MSQTRTVQTPYQRSVIVSGLRDGHMQWLVQAFTSGVDATIKHGLGRTPVGYHVARCPHGGGIVTDGSNNGTDWTTAVLVLTASVTGTYTILVF